MKTPIRFLLLISLALGTTDSLHAQWVQTGAFTGGPVECFAVSGENLFAGTLGGGVYRTTDGGASWNAVNTGMTAGNVTALAVIPNAGAGANLIAGTDKGVFRSTDTGMSWTAVDSGLTNSVVLSLAVSGTRLFAGTYDGVFCSTNNGTSWSAVNNNMSGRRVYFLAVSGPYLFAGTTDTLFRSTDYGAHWSKANAGLAENSVVALVTSGAKLIVVTSTIGMGNTFRSTDGGTSWAKTGAMRHVFSSLVVSDSTLFVGAFHEGIFRSNDGATSWQAVNAGLPVSIMRSLVIFGPNLFVGTYADGVWRQPLRELMDFPTGADNRSHLPGEFALEQNYPNPFNPATRIQFTINDRQMTSMKVFSLLGQEVAILVDEVKEPGTYTVAFDGSHLGSGMYLCRLSSGKLAETRKLLLVR